MYWSSFSTGKGKNEKCILEAFEGEDAAGEFPDCVGYASVNVYMLKIPGGLEKLLPYREIFADLGKLPAEPVPGSIEISVFAVWQFD